LLVAAPYFVVEMFEIKDAQKLKTRDESGKSSVQILVAVEGCGIVETGESEPVTMTKGDAVVVPACAGNFTVRPQWTLEFLKAHVSGAALPEPETRM
jgi:mannose-6-phosphate isomerase class I